jgi:uncharacterized protein YjbJ (UPF0337 family)
MSWNQVEGYWMQILGRLREQWGVFTHRQIDVIRGQRAQVVGRLQRRYGDLEAGRLPVSALESRAD